MGNLSPLGLIYRILSDLRYLSGMRHEAMMRLAGLFGVFLLMTGAAHAFDCAKVSLPSSLVICSDPDLMRLADERQQAFSETWNRLDEQQQRALMADQNTWVRGYATACGVPPDLIPTLPVSPAVKECFEAAGRARIAYLKAYGLPAVNPTPAPTDQGRLGPSFDCDKATQPLALTICADPQLSREDLRFAEAYRALRHQLGPDGKKLLLEQAIDFSNYVVGKCGLSASAAVPVSAPGVRACIAAAYDARRTAWLARLSPPAYQEATRPLEQHIALQHDLITLGFLPASAAVDGVYGTQTRGAIAEWQSSHGRRVTGFLGNADAAAMEQEVGGSPPPTSAATLLPPPPTQPPALPPANGANPNRVEVALKAEAGTYVVPVRINDAITLDFVVDSGAGDVSIPADVVLTLVRTHTLDDSDFIGKATYVLADGSKLQSSQFRLRELQIGNSVIHDVTASVAPVAGQLLLGQSFLSHFASWTLDNRRHVLILTSGG